MRTKFARKKKRTAASAASSAFSKVSSSDDSASSSQRLASYHSGVLGLCACVDAYPYEVPPFVPPILMELERHLNAQQQQVVHKTVKKTLQEFKRTHQVIEF